MAKLGLGPDQVAGIIRSQNKQNGWALCIGAGTSRGDPTKNGHAFPTWVELARDLSVRVDPDCSEAEIARLLGVFSADALIQAARNRLGVSVDEFGAVLSEVLYRELRTKVGAADWSLVHQCLDAKGPGDHTRERWAELLSIVRRRCPGLSAMALAEALVEANDPGVLPAAILSFNAEPLFCALLNGLVSVRDDETVDPSQPKRPPQLLDRVTRSISSRVVGRIPYYFCHGCLPVDGATRASAQRTALDKLVFSEAEYLELANTSFSWQSSVFLSACTSRTIVFVGLSLSDPNMRKWLAWAHDNRAGEIEDVYGHRGPSTRHFWIQARPGSAAMERWVEDSVAHLGVRLVWLDGWSALGATFRAMLGT